jgi:hypothetical protein
LQVSGQAFGMLAVSESCDLDANRFQVCGNGFFSLRFSSLVCAGNILMLSFVLLAPVENMKDAIDLCFQRDFGILRDTDVF